MSNRARTRFRAVPALVAALVLGAVGSGSAPAQAAICVIADPVIELGCQGDTTSASAQAGPGPSGEAPAAADAVVARSTTTVEYDPQRLAFMVRPGTPERAVRPVLVRAGVELERAIPAIGAYLVRVSPDRRAAALQELRASPIVAEAGREVIAHTLETTPDDGSWTQQIGLRVVGFPLAWDVSRGSRRVTIAVVDTGVDPAEPDLQGALVPGFNFVEPGAPPLDDHGHGTAVAGVLAARSDNHRGIAGVCWSCSIMPVKVLDRTGTGDDTVIAAGIVWAADNGAQVVNLSLGAPGDTPALAAAVAYATGKGAIVLAAAGNGGNTVPFYPAASPGAISVAATTVDDLRYDWSEYGDWVDVAAPGCNIAPERGGGYASFCGTSSATPIVAGLAALAFSAQPAATAAQIRQAIEQAAVPLPDFVRYGRVDAPRTLASLHIRTGVARSGKLDGAHPTRSYAFPAEPGPFVAIVRTPRAATLTLTLVSEPTGTPVAHVTGPTPLRLEATVDGPVRLAIRRIAGRPTAFGLSVSFDSSPG